MCAHLCLQEPRLVLHSPGVQCLPELRHDRLINVTSIRVDLNRCKSKDYDDGNRTHTLSSVTFQSLILGFGGSLVRET